MSGRTPTAADWLAYARLHNGVCPKCGTVNDFNGKPRCNCITTSAAAEGDRG